ncbi:unnamed protein product [Schistosoma mattheei]|uniref:DUF7041 domain-containing protein n=1 Tax=Schistosoma mattheei TaxID=31246 RepID=A0A183PL89_9TREM|nr:unnamed protein product [Schistosoma mattheei]
MTEQIPKVLKLKTISPPSFQLMVFWPDNIEAWFCYAEADFTEHGVTDTLAQFLAVVKLLRRKFNRFVTPGIFTSDFSEPYETLRRSIPKRGDLTDRPRLDQLLNNIDLQHGSVTHIMQRMREVTGQRTFDDGFFGQLFLSKLPQQVQVVLVSFQNNALDEVGASTDCFLEITKSSNADVFSVKEKPQTTQNDTTDLCHALTRYLNLRTDRSRSRTPRRSISRLLEKLPVENTGKIEELGMGITTPSHERKPCLKCLDQMKLLGSVLEFEVYNYRDAMTPNDEG